MAALSLKIDDEDIDSKEVAGHTNWNAFRVLKRYLEPKGDLNMDQAAILLLKMLPSEVGKRVNMGQPDLFSIIFIEVAGQIPYHHPAQVRFVRLLNHMAACDRVQSPYMAEVVRICSLIFNLLIAISKSLGLHVLPEYVRHKNNFTRAVSM